MSIRERVISIVNNFSQRYSPKDKMQKILYYLRDKLKKIRQLLHGIWQKEPFLFTLCSILIIVGMLFIFALFLSTDCNEGRSFLCSLLGANEKKDVINRLAIALAGGFSVWGLYTAHRRAEAMQDTVIVAEKRISQERFRDAMKHLGGESESVRLGGGYALFRLALGEEELREYTAVMLCSHIRAITSTKKYQKDYLREPSVEIQSLMKLLFEETSASNKFWTEISGAKADSESKIDLRARVNLSQGYFCGLKLENAQFHKANLSQAKFYGAILKKSKFHQADLRETKFHQANLQESQFHKATLWGAQFYGAKLELAEFNGAELRDVRFYGAALRESQFHRAILWRAHFDGAKLKDAQFYQAKYEKTLFRGVDSSKDTTVTKFEFQLNSRCGKESDFSGFRFVDGKDVDQKGGNDLPKNVISGKYTKTDMKEWLEEYCSVDSAESNMKGKE